LAQEQHGITNLPKNRRFIMKIAFLGLGIMGGGMAANLLRAGHSLAVWNRTVEKAAPLAELGARIAASPAGAVSGAQVVITMLSTPEAVEATALGENGFLPAMQPGALWMDSSTVGPSFSRRMAKEASARGVRFVDAPVTGSKDAAADGRLRFLVGASPSQLEEIRPLLEKMGNIIVHAGEMGMGSSIKLVFNLIVAQSMLAYAEGLALGQALGFSREKLLELTLGSPQVPPLLSLKRARMENDEYGDADFPLQWMQKDLHLSSLTGYEAGVPMPQTNAAKEVFRLAMCAGLGEEDFSAIVRFIAGSGK
jgi:3-hydroxyisobutyrate dehydrogenase-like beta-hydroxyacid dehydrogenase